jgi:hypothetical protein
MPAIIQAVQTQGALAVKAAANVVTTGEAVAGSLTSLSGQAFACAGAAVQAYVGANVSVSVTVQASASVSGSAGGPTSGS